MKKQEKIKNLYEWMCADELYRLGRFLSFQRDAKILYAVPSAHPPVPEQAR